MDRTGGEGPRSFVRHLLKSHLVTDAEFDEIEQLIGVRSAVEAKRHAALAKEDARAAVFEAIAARCVAEVAEPLAAMGHNRSGVDGTDLLQTPLRWLRDRATEQAIPYVLVAAEECLGVTLDVSIQAGGAAVASQLREAGRGLGRFMLPPIHFAPDSLTYSVPLFPRRQRGRTPGGARRGGRGFRAH
jgi:hypothetical protein